MKLRERETPARSTKVTHISNPSKHVIRVILLIILFCPSFLLDVIDDVRM